MKNKLHYKAQWTHNLFNELIQQSISFMIERTCDDLLTVVRH